MIRTYTAERAARSLVRQEDGSECYEPGDLVGWLGDPRATGTVISVDEDGHCFTAVTVLWTTIPSGMRMVEEEFKGMDDIDLRILGRRVR